MPLFSNRAFLLRRLIRYAFAEVVYLLGNVAPRRMATMLWHIALGLNPHHVAAALNRARALQATNNAGAWLAFQDALRAIENPHPTSASDLALTWVPGRWVRRLAQRILWRDLPADYLMELHDRRNQAVLAQLAQAHFSQTLTAHAWERARLALAVWQRTQPSLASVWAEIELEFHAGNFLLAAQRAAPLVTPGNFLAPLDALTWAERWLEQSQLDLAETCLRWAETWTPELAAVWRLRGRLAHQRRNLIQAQRYYERARALAPDDLATFLAHQSLQHSRPLIETSAVRLRVNAPTAMHVNDQAQLECQLEGARGDWTIHVLPPAGWGVIATPRQQITDANHRCVFTLRACRPQRIRGEAWRLTLVAVRGQHYCVAQTAIEIPDDQPGRVLVLCTEDHEIWEERGVLSAEQLRKLFIEKSQFASAQFSPWTHMVEAGSTLAMTEWAAHQDPAWVELHRAVREHLMAEVRAGNDIQPHWHAFNDPRSPDFPYRLTPAGWTPNDQFLLTAEERRRDFARAYPPPERIRQVADVVAQVERIARQGDPNYRAVMWRTGQLEFGDDANDRAWSAIALLRAGIIADSDLRDALPAFFAGIADPFVPRAGGELIQLPIWGNLEGNFFHDAHALQQRVQTTLTYWRDKPGVHLFTLLTHAKFINARRGGDEFRLDAEYGDWVTMRAHLAEWRKQGARFVTARQGIAEWLDDHTWRLVAWLSEETRVNEQTLRYTLRWLGKNLPVSTDYPHHVLVTIPPFLRARVTHLRVYQGDHAVPVEWNRPDCFWLIVSQTDPPVHCEFQLKV